MHWIYIRKRTHTYKQKHTHTHCHPSQCSIQLHHISSLEEKGLLQVLSTNMIFPSAQTSIFIQAYRGRWRQRRRKEAIKQKTLNMCRARGKWGLTEQTGSLRLPLLRRKWSPHSRLTDTNLANRYLLTHPAVTEQHHLNHLFDLNPIVPLFKLCFC